MTDDFSTFSLAASSVANALTAIAKDSPMPTPRWLLPLLALLFGVAALFLLLWASGVVLEGATLGKAITSGISAGAGAIGLNRLNNGPPAPPLPPQFPPYQPPSPPTGGIG